MKKMRNVLIGSLVAGAFFAAPAVARADVDVYLSFGPPAPRYEVIPPPRVGYVWVPGYWDYRNRNHYWVAGTWQRARPGYYYQQPNWVQSGGRWHLNRGGWYDNRYRQAYRDNDRDGVPNRYDRSPNGRGGRDNDRDGLPNRYDPRPNDRDSDNDGIRDGRDRYPTNPYRG